MKEWYYLYTYHSTILCRGDIHHLPWPLQQAEAALPLKCEPDTHLKC
ncbi:hypothetical protein [Paenibacillus sp. y28]